MEAAARCQAYAACSALAASPHDCELHDAPGAHGRAGAALAAARAGLLALDPAQRRRQYSALFEVGDEGPPLPLREAVRAGGRAAVREEVVRFYEHFHYTLDERHAWQPDHLSVQLEFMHLLCFREAQADGAQAALPWQRAQADFAERHLVPWLRELADGVLRLAPGSPYGPVFAALRDFVCADAAWLRSTLPA
jgi:DMSO reductase family type II enzyme chaperone